MDVIGVASGPGDKSWPHILWHACLESSLSQNAVALSLIAMTRQEKINIWRDLRTFYQLTMLMFFFDFSLLRFCYWNNYAMNNNGDYFVNYQHTITVGCVDEVT